MEKQSSFFPKFAIFWLFSPKTPDRRTEILKGKIIAEPKNCDFHLVTLDKEGKYKFHRFEVLYSPLDRDSERWDKFDFADGVLEWSKNNIKERGCTGIMALTCITNIQNYENTGKFTARTALRTVNL